LHPRCVSSHSAKVRDEDDPFYTHDEFGRPLDPDSIARRQMLKRLQQMSTPEFLAHLVKIGIHNPDGTLAEPYRDNGEPSKHRPTD
jgi:hypothetical protein